MVWFIPPFHWIAKIFPNNWHVCAWRVHSFWILITFHLDKNERAIELQWELEKLQSYSWIHTAGWGGCAIISLFLSRDMKSWMFGLWVSVWFVYRYSPSMELHCEELTPAVFLKIPPKPFSSRQTNCKPYMAEIPIKATMVRKHYKLIRNLKWRRPLFLYDATIGMADEEQTEALQETDISRDIKRMQHHLQEELTQFKMKLRYR